MESKEKKSHRHTHTHTHQPNEKCKSWEMMLWVLFGIDVHWIESCILFSDGSLCFCVIEGTSTLIFQICSMHACVGVYLLVHIIERLVPNSITFRFDQKIRTCCELEIWLFHHYDSVWLRSFFSCVSPSAIIAKEKFCTVRRYKGASLKKKQKSRFHYYVHSEHKDILYRNV